jgi:glycerol-1-phosphate dehydrogenase [NAD(P)+]
MELWRSGEDAVGWEEVRKELLANPDETEIAELLEKVGCPASVTELGISEELLQRSLREAHLVRPNRCTLLHAYNRRKG